MKMPAQKTHAIHPFHIYIYICCYFAFILQPVNISKDFKCHLHEDDYMENYLLCERRSSVFLLIQT